MGIIPTTEEAVHDPQQFMDEFASLATPIWVLTSYMGAPREPIMYIYRGLEINPRYPRSEGSGPWVMLQRKGKITPHSVRDLTNEFHGVFKTERQARECLAIRQEAAKNPESQYHKLIENQKLDDFRLTQKLKEMG